MASFKETKNAAANEFSSGTGHLNDIPRIESLTPSESPSQVNIRHLAKTWLKLGMSLVNTCL